MLQKRPAAGEGAVKNSQINVSSINILMQKSHIPSINYKWMAFGVKKRRVCCKTSHQVDHKIATAPVSGMLNLAGVLQKIVYRFYYSPLP